MSFSDDRLNRFLQEEESRVRVRAEQWSAAQAAQRVIHSLHVTHPDAQKLLKKFFSPVRDSFFEEEQRRRQSARRQVEASLEVPQQECAAREVLASEERLFRDRVTYTYGRFYEQHVQQHLRVAVERRRKLLFDEAECRQQLRDEQVVAFAALNIGKRLLHLERREAEARRAAVEVLWSSSVEYIASAFQEEQAALWPKLARSRLLSQEQQQRRQLREQQEREFTAMVYYESCKIDLEGEEAEYRNGMVEILWSSGLEFILAAFCEEKEKIVSKQR